MNEKICDCNQGRAPCTCDKTGTVERSPIAFTLTLIAAIFIGCLYFVAHALIGG